MSKFRPSRYIRVPGSPQVLAALFGVPVAQTPHEHAHLKPPFGYERKDRSEPPVPDSMWPDHAQGTCLRGGGGGDGGGGARNVLGITARG